MIKIDVDFVLNVLKNKQGKAHLEDFLKDFPLPKNSLTSEDENSTALAIIKQLFIMVESRFVRIEAMPGEEPMFIMLKDFG